MLAEVESLANYGKFSQDIVSFVRTKCKVNDPRDKVWSIHNKYMRDFDRDDFIDSLTRLYRKQNK